MSENNVGSPDTVIVISDDEEIAQAAPVVPAEVAPVPKPAAAGKKDRGEPVRRASTRKATSSAKAVDTSRDHVPGIILAIEAGMEDLFDRFMRHDKPKVNVQSTLNGVKITPLIAALNAKQMGMVERLINAGADENLPQPKVHSALTVARCMTTRNNDVFTKLKNFIKTRDDSRSGVDVLLAASLKVDAEEAIGAAKVVGDGGSAVSPNAKVGIPEAAGGTGSPYAHTGDTTEDDDENATGGSGGQAGPNKVKRLRRTCNGFETDSEGEFIADDREPRLITKHDGGFGRRPRQTSPNYSGV
jgi:hypothetical protein